MIFSKRPLLYMGCISVIVSIFYCLLFPIKNNHIKKEKIIVQGTVSSLSRKDGEYVYKIKDIKIVSGEDSYSKSGANQYKINEKDYGNYMNIYSKSNSYNNQNEDRLFPGNVVIVKGDFIPYKTGENPGEFSSLDYYYPKDMKGYIKASNIEVISRKKYFIRSKIYEMKNNWEEAFDKVLSKEDAGLLKGIILGNKNDIEEETKDLYKDSGVLHILTISGLHISLLGIGIYEGLKKILGKKAAGIISSIIIMFYMILSGVTVSIVRASGSLFFSFLGKDLGKIKDNGSVLGFMCMVVLFFQPYYVFQMSFILSFSTILFLGVIIPEIKSQGFLSLVIFQLGILPLLLHFYYVYPLYTLLINLVILPFFSLLVISGWLCAGMFYMSISVSELFGKICHLIILFYEKVCSLFQKLPGNLLYVGKPRIWQIVFYYILFAAFILYLVDRKKYLKEFKKENKSLFGKIMVIPALCVLISIKAILPLQDNNLSIYMLSVGQGDGLSICLPNNHGIMIDGGSSSKEKIGDYILTPFFRYEGIHVIDYWFISHCDSDHFSGLVDILNDSNTKNLNIKKIIFPKSVIKDENYFSIVKLANKRNIKISFIEKGDKIVNGDLKLYCLHPEENEVVDDHNQESEVLYLSYKNFQMLFTGDLDETHEQEVTKTLIEKDLNNKIEILKVGHHGSKTSSSEEFLKSISPKYGIISAGEKNIYGHPSKEVTERLKNLKIKTFVSYETGLVKIESDGSYLKIKEFR